MRIPRVRTAVAAPAIMALAAGCATMTEPTPTEKEAALTPEEEIRAAMEDFVAALEERDVERALTWVSDSFIDPQGRGKPWLRASWAAFPGALASVKIRMNDCKIVVTGDAILTQQSQYPPIHPLHVEPPSPREMSSALLLLLAFLFFCRYSHFLVDKTYICQYAD